MKITVVNGSPRGEGSVTLYTVKYIQKYYPEHEYTYIHAGKYIKKLEKDFSDAKQQLEEADLIIFAYPVYTFLCPSQLHHFINLMKENDVKVEGKPVTQITTSKHFYDVTAHKYIEANAADMKMRCIRGLSADMDDLLHEEGQKDALGFFSYVEFSIKNAVYEPFKDYKPYNGTYTSVYRSVVKSDDKRCALVTNLKEGDTSLKNMIDDFMALFPYQTEIINLTDMHMRGGCVGCLSCANDGKCIYKDDYQDYLLNHINNADCIIYAFSIEDHSMGWDFKMYDDRQFCNGHRSVTMGKPVGYLINGDYDQEENLHTLIEARADVGHNFLVGTATDAKQIYNMVKKIDYAFDHEYVPPQQFYGVGGMKIFRDLIYVMGGLMTADHEFYKEQGFFDDMPHKQQGRKQLMYLVGALLKNPKLASKGGSTEGLGMLYENVLKNK
ncbi:MAG: NAD(P)H-dependent oxidoreductase [Erysipelotrichaceae bacterium]|nr:NAD(P)H-dependent oxidoreductase [Erysipelotrichaceae bacterium]